MGMKFKSSCWLVFVFFVVFLEIPLAVSFAAFDPAHFPKKEVLELQSDGRRVGYAITTFEMKDGGFVFAERSTLLLRMGTKDAPLKTFVEVKTDSEIRTLGFRYEIEASNLKTVIVGKKVGSGLVLDIQLNGEDYSNTVAPKGKNVSFWDFLLTPTIKPRLFYLGLEKRRHFSAQLFEPNSFSFVPIAVDIEPAMLEGQKVSQIEALYLGQRTTAWFSSDGRSLKSVARLGKIEVVMTPFKGKEADIRSLERISGPGIDVLVSTAIPVEGAIRNARQLSKLKVEIRGVELAEFRLANHRQKLSRNGVAVTKESIPAGNFGAAAGVLELQTFGPYLKDEPFIEVTNREIVALAKKIVGKVPVEKNGKEFWKASMKILEWVYTNIKKESVISLPDALTVLRDKRGDCNEHATLFVALVRAAGIPAKVHVGIVYDGKASFLYHAWASVYVGQWVSLDPTWNQVPADPTHISFEEGGLENQQRLIALVGNLRVKVLEAK